MQTTRMPAYLNKSSGPVTGERNAWYAWAPRDGLSSQVFFDSRAPLKGVSTETALMYAVLEETFLWLQKAGKLTSLVRRQAREAEQWFLSHDSRSVFSFLNICDALGLDPGYTRKKLKHWRLAGLDMARAKR